MAGHDSVGEEWRKSSASGDAGCVEIRFDAADVHIRDTKNRGGAKLTFTHREWRAFLTGVRRGEFDLPNVTAPE